LVGGAGGKEGFWGGWIFKGWEMRGW
jgi:hypothetical protein